ncbi:hypothetical protein FRC09_015728 [Ceratobasidium sp. 395]|nr:hypothetical protein FRC09_015728 [Ceratobasidium sp. 395]
MSPSEIEDKACSDEFTSYSHEKYLAPPLLRTERVGLEAKSPTPQTEPKQRTSLFGKLLKSTQAIYDHLGEDTWILDRRLDSLDKKIPSDEAVLFLASHVPKTSETKKLYRMLDDYLDRPNTSSEPQVDNTILMIELGVWQILDKPDVAGALLGILALLYRKRFEQGGDLSDIVKSIDCYTRAVSFTSTNQNGCPKLLCNQGISYLSRFKRVGDLADVDRAIEVFVRAASSLSTDSGLESRTLSRLGAAYYTRFEHSGSISDIDKSIDYYIQALSLLPDGHEDISDRLEFLGMAYRARHARLGQPADVDNAISKHEQAVSLTPSSDPRIVAKLANLAAAYQSRFRYQHSLEDIQKALDRLKQAVNLAPSDYPELPSILNNLGAAYSSRFRWLGEPSDNQKAIETLNHALSLYSDGNPGSAGCHTNLGIAYQRRFRSSGQIDDLQLAIHHESQAVELTPGSGPEKAVALSNLGVSYHSRYGHLGDFSDLERAIECDNQAIALTPEGHPEKPRLLNSLGASYRTQFKCLDDIADLNKAMEYTDRAVSLTSDERADAYRPIWLANLGILYMDRFDRLREAPDLDKAIDHLNEVVALALDGHAELATWLDALGLVLNRRFEHGGTLDDINRAIECQTQAVDLTSRGHTDEPARLDHLGTSYYRRFSYKGNLEDLDKAIERHKLAISLTPEGHTARPSLLNNLGASYNSRFVALAVLEDIDSAINYGNEAVALALETDPSKPDQLNNLATSYYQRFRHLGEQEDLDNAIERQMQAISLSPENHPNRPSLLHNLGALYELRFSVLGAIPDSDKAMDYFDQAVRLTGPEHADRPMCLTALGAAYKSRYKRSEQSLDINKAIEYLYEAVDLTRMGHASFPFRYHALGRAFQLRFESQSGTISDSDQAIDYMSSAGVCTPEGHGFNIQVVNDLGDAHLSRYLAFDKQEDVDKALEYFQQAAESTIGLPRPKFGASLAWAGLAKAQKNTALSLKAFGQTMRLAHQVLWIGSAVGRRYEDLKSDNFGRIAMEAAAVAIEAQEYMLALEWLEQGRSIVWNQMLQIRTPLDEVAAIDPELARELKEVAGRLDQPGSSEAADHTMLSASAKSVEKAAQEHRRLSEQWGELLDKARRLPGLSGLLRPKPFSEITRAAESSTVVVLSIYRERCDALIIPENTTSAAHVPLPGLSYETAAQLNSELLGSLQHAHVRSRGLRRPIFDEVDNEDKFESVLATLWDSVGSPVLDHLGYLSGEPTDQLPRITWCATGPLAFLPIHAAGHYDESPARIFDYVVSSYTPTLSAMLVPHQAPTEFRGILAIGQANTAGCAPLPGTIKELKAISEQVGSLRYTQLDENDATPEAILAEMGVHDWVHMACHGSQNNTDPTKSAFHVHGGTLELATIAHKSMSGAGLAFLSACQTATGDEKLPEEAVHLAAGMIVAGYHTVIATMWSIHDDDAPLIAEKVYGYLLKDGVPGTHKTARALHDAVGFLRDKVGDKEYSRWVPYLHLGI